MVATAPGKVIIFGEHAVVYGRPAIAVPVTDVQARAEIVVGEAGSGLWLLAADLPAPDGSPGGHRYRLREAAEGDPLRVIVELALDAFSRDPTVAGGLDSEPDLLVSVTSTIPIARGLGSGAAVATAVARALAHHFGGSPLPEEISRLVYEVEKLHHGTPSGIDNSVIAYEQPVFFVRGEGIMPLSVGAPLSLVIADTGVVSSTREVVGDLRRRWQVQPEHYEGLFDKVGAIARLAKVAIEHGDLRTVGQLMNENHELLKTIGVSSLELDMLVEAALATGALGAKMSGAGWGGNMLALVEPHRASDIANALREAGAARTIFSEVL
ncbi:MAG: mevalonate kinase [Anaerolineae bacterium]|jgi:mevalonate kinase